VRILFIAAASLLALTPARAQQAALDDTMREHPRWFTEEGIPYRPCPAAVVFSSGRHACLGLPEYPYSITVNLRPRHLWRGFWREYL
jgi:hypothetical protein